MTFRKIDKGGYYIGDVEIDTTIKSNVKIDGIDYIYLNWTGQVLYEPQWDFENQKWIEGLALELVEKKLAIEKLKAKIIRARGLIEKTNLTWDSQNRKAMLLAGIDGYWTEIKTFETT